MNTYYALCDPRELDPLQSICYIGKTTRHSTQRLADHIYEALSGRNDARCRWIRNLLVDHVRPTMLVLTRSGQDLETNLIQMYRKLGCPLTNSNDGGLGQLNASQETRDKQRQAMLRKQKT